MICSLQLISPTAAKTSALSTKASLRVVITVRSSDIIIEFKFMIKMIRCKIMRRRWTEMIL